MTNSLDSGLVWSPLSRDVVGITGADRVSFLHNLCTQDIKRLDCGRMAETLFLNVRGKIIGHGLIFAEAAQHLLILPQGTAAALMPSLDRYIIREDVQLTDRTADCSFRAVHGAEGAEVLRQWFPTLESRDVDVWTTQQELDTVTLRRTCYAPPWSYLVEASPAADRWWEHFAEKAPTSPPPIPWHLARIAAGWPEYGQDIDERNLPQELDRDASAIHFQKGCYLGQETVARIDALGHVNQYLRGLRFVEGAKPAPGMELLAGENWVGRVTSCYSDSAAWAIGLGYVHRSHATPGTALSSACGEVQIVSLPMSTAMR